MNQELELALQRLFERVPQTKEVAEFREELFANTREKYEDLLREGYSPEQANSVILEGIGDMEQLLRELAGMREGKLAAETPAGSGPGDGLVWDFGVRTFTFVEVDSRYLNCELRFTADGRFCCELQSNLSDKKRSRLRVGTTDNWLRVEVLPPIATFPWVGQGLFTAYGRDEKLFLYLPEDFRGELNLGSSSGSVFCERDLCLSRFSAATASGALCLTGLVSESFRVHTASGSVQAEMVQGKGEITTASGGIRLHSLQGNEQRVRSVSGSIHIEYLKGQDCALSAVSGSVCVKQLTGGGEFKSVSGSVKMEAVTGGGVFSTVSGSVRLARVCPEQNLTLRSQSGSVRATFMAEPSARIEASSMSGSVCVGEVSSGRSYCAKLGDSNCQITAKSTAGSVCLEW